MGSARRDHRRNAAQTGARRLAGQCGCAFPAISAGGAGPIARNGSRNRASRGRGELFARLGERFGERGGARRGRASGVGGEREGNGKIRARFGSEEKEATAPNVTPRE